MWRNFTLLLKEWWVDFTCEHKYNDYFVGEKISICEHCGRIKYRK